MTKKRRLKNQTQGVQEGEREKFPPIMTWKLKQKKASTTCAAQITEEIPCHVCSTFYAINSKELARHFQQVHLEHFVTERKEPISQYPILKALAGKKKLNAKCFNTLLKKEEVVEVKVAGSEYFLTSVIVALGAMGIRKVDSVLCTDILNEVKQFYKGVLETPESTPEDKKVYIDQCTGFVQRGEYAKDIVDYCIDCTANAIEVNLTIIHKESTDANSLMQQHRCTKFSSKYNITLVYSTNTQCKTGLDVHYYCLVDATYYRKNLLKIKSQFIVPPEDNKIAATK